jgi:uncharacterized membrane protein
MFAFKVLATSILVAGVAMVFAGLIVGGRQRVVTTFDEKIMDDMADPPWWV